MPASPSLPPFEGEPLAAPAPAKINLTLEVLGLRGDGYHEIDTVLQTLELADRVTLFPDRGALTVEACGPFAGGTPCDDSNLAVQAIIALCRLTGREVPKLAIRLEKHIPPAGGLGGGASDAATVMRLLQRHWADVPDETAISAANAIGSDEAYFLLGGTARATGRGEILTPLPDLPERGVVLFVPPFTLERKTAVMFRALDALQFDTGAVTRAIVDRPSGQFSSVDVYNAFERVAFDVFRGLSVLWQQLEDRIGEPVRLAGAGPTLFWIGPLEEGQRVAASAAGLPCTVIQTKTARSLWRQ